MKFNGNFIEIQLYFYCILGQFLLNFQNVMFLLFLIIETIFVIILFFILTSVLFSTFTEAPFVPTGRRDMRRILDIAHIKEGEVFYDLGSGDGRLVIAAAKRGATAVGFERAWPLVVWSNLKVAVLGLKNQAKVKRGNFLKEDFGRADIIFCYLMPGAMKALKLKFETELKLGARVFSRAFAVPGWQPVVVHRFGRFSPPVYEYVKE